MPSNDGTIYHLQGGFMDIFSVRDLREHTGALIQDAEAGKLSLVTKRGQPLEAFIVKLGKLGISAINYTISEVNEELKSFE